MNEYAYYGKGHTIHSSGQIEWHKNTVDDKSVKVGGSQCITTLDEFALKFRVIDDSRGYEDIIDVTKTPRDKKENLEIFSGDDAENQKAKKEKLAARMANKKGYRDLMMSAEGISLNIVENATSGKLSSGDLRKAWGRLKKRRNRKLERTRWRFIPSS